MSYIRVIKKHKWLTVCVILICGFSAIHMVWAAAARTAEPGTNEDPLVSQSYVDEKVLELKAYTDSYNEELLKQLAEKAQQFDELKEQFDEKIKQFEESKTELDSLKQQLDTAGLQGSKFVIVEKLEKGQKLIADESTEIILRAGKVRAIASANGGLSDVTAGKDIQDGEFVESNHLIIVPRTDGRGVISEANSVLMVKGTFRIEQE